MTDRVLQRAPPGDDGIGADVREVTAEGQTNGLDAPAKSHMSVRPHKGEVVESVIVLRVNRDLVHQVLVGSQAVVMIPVEDESEIFEAQIYLNTRAFQFFFRLKKWQQAKTLLFHSKKFIRKSNYQQSC